MSNKHNVLNAEQFFRLAKFVEQEYVKQGLTDGLFSLKATESLGFPVTDSNVARARAAANIKATRARSKSGIGLTKIRYPSDKDRVLAAAIIKLITILRCESDFSPIHLHNLKEIRHGNRIDPQ